VFNLPILRHLPYVAPKHGVLVGRAFLQIYEQRNGLVADELLPRLGARFAEGVEALAIEAHLKKKVAGSC